MLVHFEMVERGALLRRVVETALEKRQVETRALGCLLGLTEYIDFRNLRFKLLEIDPLNTNFISAERQSDNKVVLEFSVIVAAASVRA